MSMKAQDSESCCALLRIKESSVLHKSLVRAILQVTGYGKKHVQSAGLVEPRGSDNDFTPEFKQVIEDFLEKRRGGIVFFPLMMPKIEGWAESYIAGQTPLVWKSAARRGLPSDKVLIEECVCLLFEAVKNDPYAFKVDDVEVIGSFADLRCEKCGGDFEGEDNEIVLCSSCMIGSHQICSNIFPIPEGDWYCESCQQARQRMQQKKRRRVDSNEISTTPRRRARKKRPCIESSDEAATPSPRYRAQKQRPTTPVTSVAPGTPAASSVDMELSAYQIKNTTLYVRVEGGQVSMIDGKPTHIYRSIRLDSIDPLSDPFPAALNVWNLVDREPRILVQVPSIADGLIEFVPGMEWRDLFGLVKNEWASKSGIGGYVFVYVLLLLE